MISPGTNSLHFALHPYSLQRFQTSLAVWLLLLFCFAAPAPAGQTAPTDGKPDVTRSILSSLKSGQVADDWEPKTPALQRLALGIRILGFFLVPLALASISGMFK